MLPSRLSHASCAQARWVARRRPAVHVRRSGHAVVVAHRRRPALPGGLEWRPSPSWWSLGDDAAALSAPMFTSRGRVWRTSSTRDLFRALAFAAGLTPSEYGAKSGRIGGATDARDRVGDGSADVVKRRGRWASDVAEVYQRELLGPQLDLSASLADAVGEDLERMCLGWAQPGR